MELALGVLGWSPSEFWAATPVELCAAVIGRQRAMVPPKPSSDQMGDDGLQLAPGCTREGVRRVLAEMRAEKEAQ